MNLTKTAWTRLNSLQVWKCCTLFHHRNYWVIWELHKCHWFQFINRLGYLRRCRSATTIGLWAHSRLGRKNYAMSTFKLQEKQKGLQLSPLRKVLFSNLAHSMCSIILLKSERYSKKKRFLSWRCPKIFIILTIVLTIRQRLVGKQISAWGQVN